MSRIFSKNTVPCKFCKLNFHPRIDNIKSGKGIFCSVKCRAKFFANLKKLFKNCIYCNNLFHARPRKKRFCTLTCAVRFKHPSWNPDRELVKSRKKISQFCCGLIRRCLRTKTDSTYNILGYSAEQLRRHIESKWVEGMSWNNYGMHGNNIWNIDHIKPISSFPIDADMGEINALSNLRPLWSTINYKRPKNIYKN